MAPYTVVAFYTKDTPYEKEIENLRQSLIGFNLPYKFYEYENRGSWVVNAGIKPELLLHALEHMDTDIVYLDADAVIKKHPSQFDHFKGDIGVHFRNGKELLSGTIYLKNNESVRQLIREWKALQESNPDKWDQRTFQKVLDIRQKDLSLIVTNLPSSYTKIFDTMQGEAVIEHNQASRKFKRKIQEATEPMQITHVPKGVRRSMDGTFWIPRNDNEIERHMNRVFEKLPGELRWKPKPVSKKDVSELEEIFNGQEVNIVGKGPSLDYLDENYFGPGPIVAVNEAIHKVEELNLDNETFMIQQDPGLKNTCLPKKANILISEKAANWYADYENVYVFRTKDLKLETSALSVMCAIKLAQVFGAEKLKFLCFDACVNHNTDYAEVIGYSSRRGGNPNRFLSHRQKIKRHIQVNQEWVIPEPELSELVSHSESSIGF